MACCQREGCPAMARWSPRLNVPAQGYALDAHQPMQVILCLKVCDRHMADLSAAELLAGDQLRDVIAAALIGRAPPDYDRAWIERLPCEGGVIDSLDAASARHRGQLQ